MFRLRGAGAVGMGILALGSVGWATLVFLAFRHEAFWPAATVASAVFTLVAALLYATGHPDARVVGLFGLIIFAIVNAVLCVDVYHAWDQDRNCVADRMAGSGATDTDARIYCADPAHLNGVTDAKLGWTITGTVVLAALQGAILLLASPKKPVPPDGAVAR